MQNYLEIFSKQKNNEKKYKEYLEGKYRVRELGKYIEAHQARCFGKPTFKETRVLVPLLIESLADLNRTVESVAIDYHLSGEAVKEALRLPAEIYYFDLRLPDPHPDEKPILRKYIPYLEPKEIFADKAEE